MAKKKTEPPIVTEVTIIPATNGFTIKVETKGFNTKRYVCKDLHEVLNALKTLNWGLEPEDKTLNDSLKSEE